MFGTSLDPGRVDSKNNTADANFVLLKKNRPGNEASLVQDLVDNVVWLAKK